MNKVSAWLAAIVICFPSCWAVAEGYVPEMAWPAQGLILRVVRLTVRSEDGWLIKKNPGNISQEHYAYTVIDPISGRHMLSLGQNFHNYRVSGDILLVVRSLTEEGPDRIIEGRDIVSGKRLWMVPATSEYYNQVLLGEVYEGHLFFGDDEGIHKIKLPEGEPVQTRSWQETIEHPYRGSSIRHGELVVAGGRVYFGDGHRIWGLEADDLGRGWWNWCNASIGFADEAGVSGTGIGHHLVSLRPNGEHYFEPSVPGKEEWSWRLPCWGPKYPGELQVLGDLVITEALLYQKHKEFDTDDPRRIRCISLYLAAFDRFTGDVKWKVPMKPHAYAVYGDKIAVAAGHRTSGAESTMQYRIEIYNSQGKRLWRGPILPKRPWDILGVRDRFAVIDEDGMHCYE